jgi:hypothetical protein
LAESEFLMPELSADKRPAGVAATPEPATKATGQEAAAGQPDATEGREGPLAAMMVDRKTARHKVPSRRVPGSVLTVTLLAVAVFAVAAVYLVIPKSSGSRSAATAPVAGATSISAAKAGTTTGGRHGQPAPLPGSPAKQEVSASASPPQTGPKPLQPSDPGAISSWSAEGGKALAHVTTQSENVVAARTARNYPQMLRYCTALAAAVQDAENAPPIPDTAMQQMYAESLNALKQGATDCMTGITEHHEDLEDAVVDVNQAEVDHAMSELGVGVNDLYIATSALRTI